MTRRNPMTAGQRFGRLVSIQRSHRVNGRDHWLFKCDCGAIKAATDNAVRSGSTRSCGCLRREMMREHQLRHGGADTALYRIWCGMKNRCLNQNSDSFKNYGGRGVVIAEEWSDFAVFKMDMGDRPSPLHTLERIDNNGPYSVSNCRWATRAEQNRNTRVSVKITAFGETKTLSEWGRDPRCCVHRVTLAQRIREGESPEIAMTRPDGRRRESA